MLVKLGRSFGRLNVAPCARYLSAGHSKSVRLRNIEEFKQNQQRREDNWERMIAKDPNNHIEKNLLLLAQSARLTIDNTVELPNPMRKKKQPKFGRRGKKARGSANVSAIELGYDGHNTPWYMSVPKHDFKNDGIRFINLSLGSLQHKIDKGMIDPARITMFDLISQNLVRVPKDYSGIQLAIQGVSLLEAKVNIEVTMACDRTIEAIERNGGTVLTRWYSSEAVEMMRNGIDPSSKIDLPPKNYVHKYLSSDLRGYMVGKEHLFFRSLDKVDALLKFKRQDDPSFKYDDEDHRDIIQERIDANVQHLKERSGTE